MPLDHHENCVATQLAHGTDGLDFLPDDRPVIPGFLDRSLLFVFAVEQLLELIIFFEVVRNFIVASRPLLD